MAIKGHLSGLFEEMSVPYGDSHRPVAQAVCRNCGVTQNVSLRAKSGLMPPGMVSKKFVERGWTVGSNKEWHICPDCSNAKTPVKIPILTVVKKENESMEAKEAVVKTMTREEKRIIYAKLNDVYADEKRGYESGWSDHKVATDLGVPRVWVEQVRDEMFGPVATNPEIEQFLKLEAEINLLRNEVSTLSALKGQLINVEAGLKRIDTARLMDRLNSIDKLSAEVKKHIPGLK